MTEAHSLNIPGIEFMMRFSWRVSQKREADVKRAQVSLTDRLMVVIPLRGYLPRMTFILDFSSDVKNSVLSTLNRFSVTNPKERYLMKKMNSLQAMLCMVFVVACLHISALGQSTEDRSNLAAIRSNGSSVRWMYPHLTPR